VIPVATRRSRSILKDVNRSHPMIHERGISVATAEFFGVGFFPGKRQHGRADCLPAPRGWKPYRVRADCLDGQRGYGNCGYHNGMLFSRSQRAAARSMAASEVCSF
jgi:hypothetical protein